MNSANPHSDVLRAGAEWLAVHLDEILTATAGICEVPAPPFAEQARAAYVADLFTRAGVQTHLDGCGNVVGVYQEPAPGQRGLLVTAHLDTVFPAGTDVTVKKTPGRWSAPGINDNSVSVAIIAGLIALLRARGYQPPCGLAFAATVGEDGLGDLRGMKYLFDTGLAARWPVGAVLVFDGELGCICHRGVASRRLDIVYTGPGGHSWGDFGRPSATHAAGRAIAAIDGIEVPAQPRTTFNIGVIAGGVSVNAIAARARLLVDMRSEETGALQKLESEVRSAARAAVAGREQLAVTMDLVGDRPGGTLPLDHPYLAGILAACRAGSLEARLVAASTDANIPLSRNVPAVTAGLVSGGGTHSLAECIETESVLPGARHGLALLLAALEYVDGIHLKHSQPWGD